jgi:uncharacterized membrane protein YfcA
VTAALAGALAVGLALGLLGSGGSMLTVPILIYGLGMPEKTAIASSLAIVGGIALIGTVLQARRGLIVTRCIAAFGLPGLVGAVGGGMLAGSVPSTLQLSIFAGVLLAAGVMMLRQGAQEPTGPVCGPLPQVVAAGAGVGMLTGLIGVGGGFLLVPALQRFGHIGLAAAIGTSLALIALNSALGLAGQWMSGAMRAIPIGEVTVFIAFGVAGMLTGQYGGTRLPIRVRRYIFVALLFGIGGYILLQLLARI